MAHFVYMIECCDGSIYTGYAADLDRRLQEHNSGNPKSAKYVRAKGFKRLLHSEKFDSRSAAMKREAQIKSWNRQKKLEFLNQL